MQAFLYTGWESIWSSSLFFFLVADHRWQCYTFSLSCGLEFIITHNDWIVKISIRIGLFYSALPKIISQGYKKLGLHYFFTTGADEVKAWTIQVVDDARTHLSWHCEELFGPPVYILDFALPDHRQIYLNAYISKQNGNDSRILLKCLSKHIFITQFLV